MQIGNLEDGLMRELQGMREDLRVVSSKVAELAVEVKHLAEGLSDAKRHGERIQALETDIVNLRQEVRDEVANRLSAERSAATERRWIIGMLVAGAITLLGIVVTIVTKFVPGPHIGP